MTSLIVGEFHDHEPDLTVHLRKLSVGSTSLVDLVRWQWARQAAGQDLVHVTRHCPKRKAELLQQGSMYWIIRGRYALRQRLQAIEEVAYEDKELADGNPSAMGCGLFLKAELYPVAPWPHRPFQGWRYLNEAEAPPDILARPIDDAWLNAYEANPFDDELHNFINQFGLVE